MASRVLGTSRRWIFLTMLGFALLAASIVLMSSWNRVFGAHFESPVESELALERVFFCVQASGFLIAAVGSVGLLFKMTRKSATYTGIAFLLFVSLVLFSMRYPSDIVNLHGGKIAWFVPLSLTVLVGFSLLLFGGRHRSKEHTSGTMLH